MNSRTLLFVSAIVLIGCQPVNPELRAAVPKGFLCSTSPSEAYSPGFVYRVDDAGVSSMVIDLSAEAVTTAYKMELASYDASVVSSADLSFQIGSAASGSAGASASTVSKAVFSESNLALMGDADEDALIAAIRARVDPRPGNRYFLVRDAIRAKGIEISLSSVDEAKLGGEAKILSMFSAKPDIKITRSQALSISRNSDPALNVCVRAVEIGLRDPDTGPTPVSEGPEMIVAPTYLARLLDTPR